MADAASYFAYVGSFTHRRGRVRDANGDGLHVYRGDGETGSWEHVQLLDELVNPSYLALDHTQRFLYSVHGDRSDIMAFAIDDESGTLTEVDRQNTEGINPVHLAFDPTNRFAVAVNHTSGTVVLLPRNDDGTLGRVVDLVEPSGTPGPHRIDQTIAGAHQTEFDRSGRFVVVPSKGLDQIDVYSIDYANNKLVPAHPPVITRAAAGPRHIAFHPSSPWAYVVNEIDSTVTSYRYDEATGALEPFQLVTALPDTFTGESTASEIAVRDDGRFLYSSNRGCDVLTAFSIDPDSGRLQDPKWYPCPGKTQRFFAIDPGQRFVFVGNEDSDTIHSYAIDPDTDELILRPVLITCGSPVCIVFKTK